jgi:hypothetical protein
VCHLAKRQSSIVTHQQEGSLRPIKRTEALPDTLKPLFALFIQGGWWLAMGFASDALRVFLTQLLPVVALA